MFTQAPEIKNDVTIGQVVTESTATVTATPTASSKSVYVYTPKPEPEFIKNKDLSIYGYGAINSDVTLRGFGISERTTTDDKGFFRFHKIYSLTRLYPELCIQLNDLNNRVSQPTCIPAFPFGHAVPSEVGPILLSPVISIVDGVLYGKTTPNAKISLQIFKIDNYKLPTINILSDKMGEFSVNLPNDVNFFVFSDLGNNFSMKSNTLTYTVPSTQETFWQTLLEYIKQNKIVTFLIVEVITFIILFVTAIKSITRHHRKPSERDYLEELKLLR